MPTPGAERPIQRVPSGLPGPGGTGFRPCAHEEFGGIVHGLTILVFLLAIAPLGVGSAFPFSITYGAALVVMLAGLDRDVATRLSK